MSEWKECTIADLGQVITGKTPSSKRSEFWNGQIMFVTPKDIQIIKKIKSTERTITQAGLQAVNGSIIPPNAICVSCIGNIGYVAMTTSECVSNQQINSILVNDKNDPDFVFYLMKSLWYLFKNYEGQSTTLSILNKSQFSKIEVLVPNLYTQKRISAVLSAIDEKIELNTAINENLEQQAQAIFKSWFVDFEPFGGVMPDTIQELPLSEVCDVITKGTTPTTIGKSFTYNGINFLKAESILDNHMLDLNKIAHIDKETNEILRRSVIKDGDILFTIAGTLGRFSLIDKSVLPANTNQAVAIIRANQNKVFPEYLYSFFIGNWHNEYYKKRVQQAVQANLSLTTIKSLPIYILSPQNMNEYVSIIKPIFHYMKKNELENQRLSALRDTLLPKLMNGEIDVSNVKI